ncbi:hypothetical protein MSKOL_1615 [Methanosarcina sp. Kolksee]|uniref:hypothetical protein n=1 Tax=Methanosarcina sp. Kolksee TaxID=1434099 RepID=UPI000615B31D|nr:hypothetical protein [Methanosarcina sp. Kolksee]AKB47392.1 hypothetical protein MSKOL_1615 [Methanosarcina sp. Kolksee]
MVSIIGRDGQTRKQGDTSSWKNSSSKSSGSSSSEAQKTQELQKAQAAQQAQAQQTNSFIYGVKGEEIQKKASEYNNTSGTFYIDTTEETVKRARTQGLDVSKDRSSGTIIIHSGGEATKTQLEAIHKQTYSEESEKWKGALTRVGSSSEESIVSKVASKLGVKSQLDTANKKLSAYVPSLETIQEKRDTALEKVGLLDERQKVTEAIRSNKITAGFQDWSVHGYQGLKETPVNFAAEQGTLIAGAAVGGAVIKGAGLAGRAGLTAIGATKAAGAIEPALNVGLGALTIHEASKVKSVEQGVDFIADIAVMGAGYKFGSKTSLKTYDVIRTKGLKEVPAGSMVKKSVLSGKERFPMTENPDSLAVIESFKDPTTGTKIGYHVTTAELGKSPSVRGELNPKHLSDIPGLYVSPVQEGASPNFLRISQNKASPYNTLKQGYTILKKGTLQHNTLKINEGIKKIGSGLFGTPDPLTPNALKISLNEISRLPENVRYGEWVDTPKGREFIPREAQKYMLSQEAPKGTTFLTPVLESKTRIGRRAEAEAVIVPETTLTKTGESSYFKWEGRRVKLQEYKINEPPTIGSKTPQADITKAKQNFLTNENSLTSAEELAATYRAEAPATKGILSEKGYYISTIDSRASIPTIESRGTIPTIDSRGTIPTIDSRGTIPTIDSRGTIPTIDSRGTIPTIDSRGTIPTINSRGTIPTIDSRGTIPTIDSRGTIPTIDSRGTIPTIDSRGTIPTIDSRGTIPTIDSWTVIPTIKEKEIIDFEWNIDPFKDTVKHKKTKKKMLKNSYGDPFRANTKL